MSGNPIDCAAATMSAVERIAGESKLVGKKHLFGRQLEGLVRRIAEEIVEERTNAPPQVDARDAREQAALPDHRHRHIQDGLAALASIEERGRALPS